MFCFWKHCWEKISDTDIPNHRWSEHPFVYHVAVHKCKKCDKIKIDKGVKLAITFDEWLKGK